jgi:hypothetical protein
MIEQVSEETILPFHDGEGEVRISRWKINEGHIQGEYLLVITDVKSKLFSDDMELLYADIGTNEYLDLEELVSFMVEQCIEEKQWKNY